MGSSEIKCQYCGCDNYTIHKHLFVFYTFECGTKAKSHTSLSFSDIIPNKNNNWTRSDTCKKITTLQKHKQQLMSLVSYFYQDYKLLNKLNELRKDEVEVDKDYNPYLAAHSWTIWGLCDDVRTAIREHKINKKDK